MNKKSNLNLYAEFLNLTSYCWVVVGDCSVRFDACACSVAICPLVRALFDDEDDRRVHRFECCERLLLRYGGKLHDAAFSNVNLR